MISYDSIKCKECGKGQNEMPLKTCECGSETFDGHVTIALGDLTQVDVPREFEKVFQDNFSEILA